MSRRREMVDVVVIGSGFGGSVAAARISPHAKVVLLERGKRWTAPQFQQTLDAKYWGEIYDYYPGKGILAIQGKGVGGGSLVYSNVSLRAPSRIFEETDSAAPGRRLWPEAYSRAALDPYFAKVEEMLNVVQLDWDPPAGQRWRGVPRPDRVLAEGLGNLGRTCDPVRVALTDCTDCGWCSAGCKFERKNNMTLNYIPLAERHGCDVRPEHEATSIARDRSGRYEVRYRRHDGGGKGSFLAKRVVISAGTFRTPYLLKRSKAYLWRLSRHVGRHLSVNGDIVFNAMIPGRQVERWKGKVIGSVSYDYLDEGFVFQGLYAPPLLSLLTSQDPTTGRRFGAGMKAWAKQWGRSYLGFAAFGMDHPDGKVHVGPTGPILSYTPSARTRAYYRRVHEAAKEIVEQGLGGKLAPTIPQWMNMIETVHPIGACRMAEEGPDHGAVDPDGEVWGYPGLHVMDGSILPTPSLVNPSLTIAAVAERCVEKLLEKL